MNHSLKISVSKKPVYGGIVTCRRITVRERLMRLLFGLPCRMTILVPGDSVDEIAIRENEAGGDSADES